MSNFAKLFIDCFVYLYVRAYMPHTCLTVNEIKKAKMNNKVVAALCLAATHNMPMLLFMSFTPHILYKVIYAIYFLFLLLYT